MEFSGREIWTLIHGMGFGGILVLSFPAVLIIFWSWKSSLARAGEMDKYLRRFCVCLAVLTLLAWLTVISGTYFSYAWFRAQPPSLANLTKYPQAFLLSDPRLAVWEDYGMEWKEHLAWFAPILLTTATYLISRYGRRVFFEILLFRSVAAILTIAFLATMIATLLGALVTKIAPVR